MLSRDIKVVKWLQYKIQFTYNDRVLSFKSSYITITVAQNAQLSVFIVTLILHTLQVFTFRTQVNAAAKFVTCLKRPISPDTAGAL